MSSAMQTVSQQSPPQVSAQYAPSPNPRSHSLQATPSPQPSSSRRQTAQQGDNAGLSPTPQQSQPPESANTSAINNPQDYPLPPSTRPSPVVSTSTASPSNGRPRPGRPDMLGSPPIPPPRTSSNKSNPAGASNASSRERVGNSKRSKRRAEDGTRERSRHTPSQKQQQPQTEQQSQTQSPQPQPQQQRERGTTDVTTSPGRSRRKVPPSPEGPQRAASSREPRDPQSGTAMESRSENVMGYGSVSQSGLQKEGSAIINRMVVTDPEEDIVREQRRQAEARSGTAAEKGREGDGGDDDARGKKSRHDYSNAKRKETSFGDYVLGQTIGEGEFGKVKLGWKKDGSVQVAIKLLRRESLGNNPGRLPKIYREISILRDLSHPNIVRLHEMVETDKHIGMILEYASGGELFDYILNHRYLKDNAARRLFAQLVSGVGYLHKKGIVHRDLKLENLLLDRNRNIIITDFGFANTFNPSDELGEEIEYNLTNREFVKRLRLDRPDAKGMRRGDLMQTSCGSPCYAAPELVVSDSLYTGRKVDVWSCGVILYAMLAGYLPFDDDPANPDGDNINLLYKYIVTTPLTFPEYVTPHARDMLRRVLVPDPRKRADLFEVARHSWLSEYAHVVSHITSSTTNISEIANATVPSEDQEEPSLARSASVRAPPKQRSHTNESPPTCPSHQQGQTSQTEEKGKTPRDAKRRTVQVEYVAPQSKTARGEPGSGEAARPSSSSQRTSTRPAGAREMPATSNQDALRSKPLPDTPPTGQEPVSQAGYSNDSQRNQGMPRPNSRDLARSVSELTGGAFGNQGTIPQTTTRTPTDETPGGQVDTNINARQSSRGSYSQPVAPAVATTNVQGRLAQPKSGKSYNISAPIPLQPNQIPTSASVGQTPVGQPSSLATSGTQESSTKGHKRSSTVTSIGEKLFGRSGSIFGGSSRRPSSPRPRTGKRYPPTSMKEPYEPDNSRASLDSRRSITNVFRRSNDPAQNKPRRFSLLPPSFSFKGSGQEQSANPDSRQGHVDDFVQPQSQRAREDRELRFVPTYATNGQENPSHYATAYATQPSYGDDPDYGRDDTRDLSDQIDRQFAALHSSQSQFQDELHGGFYEPNSRVHHQVQQSNHHRPSERRARPPAPTDVGYDYSYENGPRQSMQWPQRSVLQKSNRKFADAYEYERASHHSGSSGPARKVMDFFRRRGKARAGEDR